ncbi:MAG TPA: thiosulfate oxidation carrier protein SoxY [Sulfurovum sp.]|uniref:thiosulfate oxidation carrier protein SoxY n=1 Tax=Sulfurovum sp. TaxID=1969726 RepID=UPI002F959482
MKRRHFLALGFCVFPYMIEALGVDHRKRKPEAWKAYGLNEAAMALYGREKFATIQKSTAIALNVPRPYAEDRENIPISIHSAMKARTVAVFQDATTRSLVAVFQVGEEGIVSYELNIRMDFKGTLFVVLEGLDGKLYYTRQFVDILTMSCMASGG